MSHLSGKNFEVLIGDTLVHVENMSATITDNRKAVQTDGVPDGHVDGDVSCAGEIEIDSKNLQRLIQVAKAAGSWRQMTPFDIVTSGAYVDQKMKIELFGCLLNISDILSIDPKGGEKKKHKLTFEVTSPDFVRLDGVPYLDKNDTKNL